MRCARLVLIMSAIFVLGIGPGAAQSIPIPQILDRGMDQVFGRGDEKPGGYVSPSANELVPRAEEVGVPQLKALRSFDPIALPDRPAALPGLSTGIDLPNLPAYAPQRKLDPQQFRPNAELRLEARLTPDGEPIPGGVLWRLFSAVPSLDGRPFLVATSEAPSPSFDVPAGGYILHVAFGRSGVVKRIDFSGISSKEVGVIGAGGLKLDATIAPESVAANRSRLRFDIYTAEPQDGERELVASDVPPGQVVRLNAGTYHVVSTYGSVNARTQADIKVEAGKLTEATLQHRAAYLTMKLVRDHGGEAIADTAWTITSMSGDVLRESVGAFPSMVLAEGEYVISARNRQKVYQRTFDVKAGHDSDVEVLLSDLVDPGGEGVGSGD